MSAHMTLADILGRGVSMQWYEGVALVRDVAARLTETVSHAAGAPELHQIEISDSGDLNITGRTNTGEPVRRLGQLLQATLGHTEGPVQLRLVIVQATAPTPAFGSLREFDAALAYFERPGRRTVLQALYVRAAGASPISGAVRAPTLDTVAPLPAADAPNAAHPPATAKRKRVAVNIAAVGTFLLVGTAVAWYARHASVAVGVSAIARQASKSVGAAVLNGLSAVTERSGLGRLVTPDAASVDPPTSAQSSPAKRPRLRRTPPPPDPPAPPIVAFDLDTFQGLTVESPALVSQAFAVVIAEAVEDEGALIFSPESDGASPPVAVRPQLPRDLPANVTPERLCRVEMIVSEVGTVESVKLVRNPRHVHDFMFLSAAKAWRFHPALKDGRPVRFRKTVWFVSE